MTSHSYDQFAKDLVERIPEFGETLEIHLANHDELLFYVFLYEVTLEVVEAFINDVPDDELWRTALAFFEEQAARGIPDVDTMIATGFLQYLPYGDMPGVRIADHLGPILTERIAWSRP